MFSGCLVATSFSDSTPQTKEMDSLLLVQMKSNPLKSQGKSFYVLIFWEFLVTRNIPGKSRHGRMHTCKELHFHTPISSMGQYKDEQVSE